MGQIYLDSEEGVLPDELTRLSLVLTGPRQQVYWQNDSQAGTMDFFDLKGIVEALLGDLHVNDLVVGDLDNDGKADLLVRDGNDLLILKNQSAAEVLDASSFLTIPSTVSLFVQPGLLSDLNGDNYLDLFTQSQVYFNSSETASEAIEFQDQTALQTGNSPSFVLTDFNQDGILDNVQTWASDNDVLNTG